MSAKWLSHTQIGERVKEAREGFLKVGQAELAELVGRPGSQSDIAKLERGVLWKEGQPPNARLLMDIAALVGQGIEYFQPRPGYNKERTEKLAAAKWMEETAQRLRYEAMASREDELGAAGQLGELDDPKKKRRPGQP